MLLMLKLNRYIAPSVAISEIGTASAGMIVALTRRRNRKITRITSTTVRPSVSCTSCTASRIEMERSFCTLSCAPRGSWPAKLGSSA
jgi:hypothetical protein